MKQMRTLFAQASVFSSYVVFTTDALARAGGWRLGVRTDDAGDTPPFTASILKL